MFPEAKRILIAGTGWYGCHCAQVLKRFGIAFDMVDRSNGFFTGASFKNQNRLHLGFHYPRSYRTRKECFDGYAAFMRQYAHLTRAVPDNCYFIAKQSQIDFKTYTHIYQHEGIPFTPIDPGDLRLPCPIDTTKLEGAIRTDERWID